MPRISSLQPEPERKPERYSAAEVGDILSRAGDLERSTDDDYRAAEISRIGEELGIATWAVRQALSGHRRPTRSNVVDRWFGPRYVEASTAAAGHRQAAQHSLERVLRHRRLRRLGATSWTQEEGCWPDEDAVLGTSVVTGEVGPPDPEGASKVTLRVGLTGVRSTHLWGAVAVAIGAAVVAAFLLPDLIALGLGIVAGVAVLAVAGSAYRVRCRHVLEQMEAALVEAAQRAMRDREGPRQHAANAS